TYPEYQKIKLQDQTRSLKEIQQFLSKESNSQNKKALLEYFVGDNNIYAFLITSNNIELKSIPFNSYLKEQIFDLRKSVFQIDTSCHDDQFNKYVYNSRKLYQKLFLKPFGLESFQNIQNLYIVPDGSLYQIPFEVFLTQEPDDDEIEEMRYRTLSYLLNKHTISYAYSATLLLESLKKRSKNIPTYKGNLLGFAPSFESSYQLTSSKMPKREGMRNCKGDSLKALPSSRLEVNTIFQIIGGQIFLQTDANKTAFLEEARHYQILHLSTHACMDEGDFESSRIYFADQALLSKELYPLQLNAELAVLSACETGTGPIQQGEGVMSLARAFLYAGCPSVISSLWSVNDEKTSELMSGFYTNLKEGQTKSSALQNAKISYINDKKRKNENAHPFYWAAFVQIGNPNSIVLEGNRWKFWGMIDCFGFWDDFILLLLYQKTF
ncbi:MAG: CHAT domain-containing protein, partial [Chitinophagales bacterium]